MTIITILALLGTLFCLIGIYKIKYRGETFKGLAILILGMVIIFPASVLNDIKHDLDAAERNGELKTIKEEIKDEVRDQVIEHVTDSTPQDLGVHWISDANGIYLWNPEPQDGESIHWSGGYVQDGNYKFADGSGVVTWYRNGQVIQVDEGTFERGRHHGQFKHTFPSGNVDYSNWSHGVEIP